MTLKEKIKLFIRRVECNPPMVSRHLTVRDWGDTSLSFQESIPSIIWIYWHSEIITSPITKFCVEKIKNINPNLTVRLLNQNNLKEWLPEFPEVNSCLPLANVSDLIRLMLLDKYGGFYLDASVLLTEPIHWLTDLREKHHSEFVGYYTDINTRNSRYPTIETWCIGAIPHSAFIHDWLDEYKKCFFSIDPDAFYDNHPELSLEESVLGGKYHKCYFSCQLVIRRKQSYRLTLIKADDDAFLYSLGIKKNWNDISLAEFLLVCKAEKCMPKMIKIINTARKRLDEWVSKGYYRKDSYLGQYIGKEILQ